MVEIILNREKYRKYVELLYEDYCDIYEYVCEKDPINNRTVAEGEIKINKDKIPCRLSYVSVESPLQGVGGALSEKIKLFLSPYVKIKPNSKIVVLKGDENLTFKATSIAKVYKTHQEIIMEVFDKWA